MKPVPWSHSALEDFKNCPRAYYEKRIAKSVVEQKHQATIDGERDHKHFEDRLKDGVVLPDHLSTHEEFLARLESLPGQQLVEQEIALNQSGQPCGYWDPNVWYRGKIDYKKLNGHQARVIDWKTGKQHQKMLQLYEYMLHTFIAHPEIQLVRADYYWTQTKTLVGVTFGRERIGEIWSMLLPDLRQFAQAFHDDIWQPRQSGLCKRHCPVTGCEFNGLGLRGSR